MNQPTAFHIGDHVVITDVKSSFYYKKGVVQSVGTVLSFVKMDSGETIHTPTDYLDYTTDEKIKRLPTQHQNVVTAIIPGKWVAYDDNSMYFSTFSDDATPVFNKKTTVANELAAVYLDGRKRKTIERKQNGVYWYTYPDCNDRKQRHCHVIERVTPTNIDRLRELCIAGLRLDESE